MRFGRAIVVGALAWILIFVEWSVIMFAPVLKDLGNMQWAVHYVVLILIAIFCAWLYYRSGDKANGFVLGMIMLIIGVILDAAITVPLFIKSYSGYFGNPLLWGGFLELVVLVGLYDLIQG